MLWDFGLNSLHMDNPAAVEGKIQEIEDTFHLGRLIMSEILLSRQASHVRNTII